MSFPYLRFHVSIILFSLLTLQQICAQCFTCADAPKGTIWCDDFENSVPLEQKYFEYDSNNGDFVVLDTVGRDHSRGIRIVWQKGEVSAGSIKKSFGKTPSSYIGKNSVLPDSNFKEIYWRMDVKHQKGWKGGGPAKLTRALTLANNQWATGLMAHLWSGGKDNLYLGMDPASGISENGILKSTKYNDFQNLRWLGFKAGTLDVFSSNNSDKWYCIEGHVKLNTPQKKDGIFEFWINDTLQAGTYDLNWHGDWNSDSSHFGINSIFFENYWNEGSPILQERYFDNVVISTQRISCKCSAIKEVQKAELPHTEGFETCFPDTNGYMKITVGSMNRDFSDLQDAINTAKPGTLIIIDAGYVLRGSYKLPKKENSEKWIIIMSARMDALPNEAERINPFAVTGIAEYPLQKDVMPKIVTVNTSGIPCFYTESGAHHYRLVGLEITADTAVKNSYGLVNLGENTKNQSTLNSSPGYMVIDRCYVHGHSKADIMKYGVGLNCRYGAVIDSYISDFHSVGYDAQAISGTNGQGPFKILNNYLEASGENIMFGGAAPTIAGLVPSDIEIKQNYFFKPLRWRVGSPEYEGKHWTIKNLFELKTGKRVLLEGNIMENSWADLPIGQSGYAIVLTIRTENDKAPQADVGDITIRNNLVRNCGAGITISGRDDGGKGIRSERITIVNNLFDNINGKEFGDLNVNGPNDGTFIKLGEPYDVIVDHNTIFQTGPITWVTKKVEGFTFTNNITNSRANAAGYQGIYGPGYQQGNKTIEYYFNDITDESRRMDKNVFIGGDEAKYTNFSTMSKNYFPIDEKYVGFTNFLNGRVDIKDYLLLPTSVYKNAGSGGKSIGADYEKIDSAIHTKRLCNNNSNIAVQSVRLDKKTTELSLGDSTMLKATILPSNASNKNVRWSVENADIISVDINGKVKTKQVGTSYVMVETESGRFKDSCLVKVLSVNSINEETTHSHIRVIPNPAKNTIKVDMSTNEIYSIEILNVFCQRVSHVQQNSTVDVQELESGVYFIKVIVNREVLLEKFIKE